MTTANPFLSSKLGYRHSRFLIYCFWLELCGRMLESAGESTLLAFWPFAAITADDTLDGFTESTDRVRVIEKTPKTTANEDNYRNSILHFETATVVHGSSSRL